MVQLARRDQYQSGQTERRQVSRPLSARPGCLSSGLRKLSIQRLLEDEGNGTPGLRRISISGIAPPVGPTISLKPVCEPGLRIRAAGIAGC